VASAAVGFGLGTLTDSAGGATPTAATSDTPFSAYTAAPAPTAPIPSPAGKPVTVFTGSGVGLKTTEFFTVHGDWDLRYRYACPGDPSGVFAVSRQDQSGQDRGDYLNESSGGRSDVTHLHDGGTMALSIRSTCTWTIKVIQLP
jgi:hypothetical protein